MTPELPVRGEWPIPAPPRSPDPDETALLVRRARAGFLLVLACVALFTLGDLDVRPEVLVPLYGVKSLHVVILLALLRALRAPLGYAGARAVALAGVVVSYAGIATSDAMAGHLETTPLLGVVTGMAAATLLPWGVWPQAVAAGVIGTGTAATLALTGKSITELADPATAVAGALAVSVYLAYEFRRYRVERWGAEAALAERARLEALRADVRASATEPLTLHQHLQACAEAVVRRLDAAFARIWTLDDTGTLLELRASAGLYTHTDGAHGRVPVGHLKIGRIAEERRPHLTNAVLEDPRIGDREWARRERLVAFAGYPLLVEDRLLGVVAMFARQPLGEATLEGLGSVAHAIAQSIEHERATAALVRSQARLGDEAAISAALARLAEEMFASLDTPVVLERLCQLTTEVLGGEASSTLLWQPEQDAFVPVALNGLGPQEEVVARGSRVARESMVALLNGKDVVEYRSPRSGNLHVCMALRRGKDLVGVQTARWPGADTALTPRRRRIAQGIARIASMALANARLVEEIERANRLKSEFVSTMSHELRTPLNVILGYAEMARDPAVERDTCLERIETAGRELFELIQGTLEVGRIEAGREEMVLARVHLEDFWTKLGESCGKLPRSPEVSLVWEAMVPDGMLVTDQRKLAIVIRNLVGNALKFTERGRVEAAIERRGETLVVRVADTGIGIRPEDQHVIFEMFRQADGSDSRRYGGTGLGLYIVRRFVQRLGGSVTLDSTPGWGSVFTVTLPWQDGRTPVSDAA